MTNNYSEALKSKTRNILDEQMITYDLMYHFKHETKGFATLDFMDLRDKNYILKHKNSDLSFKFSDIDELLDAGWVID
ncbi:hypothetical protein [Thorsellia anophelis]|uniref:Uncharacterized protein n=1 Tax=Thorsellia anophelis DSM 18579 TaxID=1123402 RepID=A0A1I0FZG0_9GAMM|nr:hypothetical protein [Thorsellia anophelis]SET63689.1 hypothetical protein SAMN02583745_02940 [Thorsellia anophelis DSM 18579]